jgi:magnesium transporter
MNFEYMPELRWRWAYPVLLLVLAMLGGSMFMYFKKKRWF